MPAFIFIPLDVRFGRDDKVLDLVVRFGVEGFAASDIYLRMACASREADTDGLVTETMIGQLAYPLPEDTWRRLVGMLEAVELIARSSGALRNRQADAWQVLAYVRRNGTREEHERRREHYANLGRTGGLKSPGQGERKRQGKRRAQAARLSERQAHAQAEVEVDESTPNGVDSLAGARAREPVSARRADTDERPDPQTELGGGLSPASAPEGARPSPPSASSAASRHPSFRTALDALQQANHPADNPGWDRGRDSEGATMRGAKLARELLAARGGDDKAAAEDDARFANEAAELDDDMTDDPDYEAPF